MVTTNKNDDAAKIKIPEIFQVWQKFRNNANEHVDSLSAEEAVTTAVNLSTSVGARAGTTVEVWIVDSMDCTVWHWEREEGIVFGTTPEHLGKLKNGIKQ